MTCTCSAVCRIPDIETENGRWPMPHHSPMCDEHTKEMFVRVELDGSWCVMEPCEAHEMVSDTSEEYKTEYVYLTRDQFNSLPEFEGF